MMRSVLNRMLVRAQSLRSPMVAMMANTTSVPPHTLPKSCVASISPLFGMERNYSEGSKAKEPDVQVPIPMFGVAGNYASALYVSAVRANVLDKVELELQGLMEAAKNTPAFQNFMKDSSVPTSTRIKAVQEISDEAGFSDITKNFLAVAAEHRRLRDLEKIINAFVKLVMAHRGEVKAIITTVIPLPMEEQRQMKEVLEEILGPGKTVLIEQKIDTSILGGFVIELGDKLFDISIKTRAKQMERLLSEPIDFQNLELS